MKTVTSGEKLFSLIKNEILDSIRGGLTWNGLDSLIYSSGGGSEFGSYIKGATSIYSLKRLMQYWRHHKILILNEAIHANSLAKYIGQEVFIGLEQNARYKLARAVIVAEQSSNQNIPKSIKEKYRRLTKRISCYLCNETLNVSQNDQEQDDFFTLDHLWPASLGGDSVDENLLPACLRCQKIKGDFLSWEWFNVQNAVWSVDPSVNEISKIPWTTRIAKHYLEALYLAEEKNLGFKDAFLSLGPVITPLTYTNTNEAITFFDLNTA